MIYNQILPPSFDTYLHIPLRLSAHILPPNAIHPTNNTKQDTITITQEAGYNSVTDTAEFYYNASQDYTNYTIGTDTPDEGTLVS